MPFSAQKKEELLSEALNAYYAKKFPSINAAAAHFGVSKHKLRNRKNDTPSSNGRKSTNSALNPSQEKSLIRWIELLISIYTPPTAIKIGDVANRILIHSGSDQKVSKIYGYNFIRRLPPHLSLKPQKPIEKTRIEAESHGPLLFWYEIYGNFLKKHDIQPNELYN